MSEKMYYPIKNCKGYKVKDDYTRKEQWGIINERGKVIDQNTHKCLSEIGSLLTLDILSLSIPGQALEVIYISNDDKRETLKVRDTFRIVEAIEEREEVSECLTKFLSLTRPGKYRLVRLPDLN